MADAESEDRQAKRASERRRKADKERERRLSIVSVNEDGTEDLVVLNIEWVRITTGGLWREGRRGDGCREDCPIKGLGVSGWRNCAIVIYTVWGGAL